MRRPPVSIWLTLLMSIYASALFIYEFAVRRAGFSLRNIALALAAVALIAACYFLNARSERKHRIRHDEKDKTPR